MTVVVDEPGLAAAIEFDAHLRAVEEASETLARCVAAMGERYAHSGVEPLAGVVHGELRARMLKLRSRVEGHGYLFALIVARVERTCEAAISEKLLAQRDAELLDMQRRAASRAPSTGVGR